MDVEIITIGDEIVTGHITDTNAGYIARRLTQAGFRVKYHSSVGDSTEEMEEAFRLALKRARVVIVTGGLGPTDDDVTKKAIVKVFRRNLVFHEDILEEIKRRYTARGVEMPAINQNQALLPQGAIFFPNKTGSAVGIGLNEQGRLFFALPGVPAEAKQILDDELLPYLAKMNIGAATSVISLRTTGIYESRLAELISPQLKLGSGVKLAYLPSYGGVSLRVIATADNQEAADNKVKPVVAYLEKTVGRYTYGHDNDTLEGVVGQLLQDNDKSLAVAESCTGGQLGMMITSVAGASNYFVGGLIAYDNDVKMNQLNVSEDVLKNDGAVSEACATAMATGCRQLFGSDYALAITGVAGPAGGTEQKPVGTTYIGLASAQSSSARRFNLGTDRTANRIRATYAALEMLRRHILDIT